MCIYVLVAVVEVNIMDLDDIRGLMDLDELKGKIDLGGKGRRIKDAALDRTGVLIAILAAGGIGAFFIFDYMRKQAALTADAKLPPYPRNYTIPNIAAAATALNNSWTNKTLSVTIQVSNGKTMDTLDMSTFFYLLCVTVVKIYEGKLTVSGAKNVTVVLNKAYNEPSSEIDQMEAGTMGMLEAYDIASKNITAMNNTGTAPGQTTNTSLGPNISFHTMIHMMIGIIAYWNSSSGELPAGIYLKPWNS